MGLSSTFSIQSAILADLPQIHKINTYYVLNTTISFQTHPSSLETIISKYHEIVHQQLPYLVATRSPTESNTTLPTETVDSARDTQRVVLGYIFASPFNNTKLGYASSLELTLYVHPGSLAGGVGSALLRELISQLQGLVYSTFEKGHEDKVERVRVRRLYSIVSQDLAPAESVNNQDVGGWKAKGENTIAWYRERFGFEQVGRLRGVGQKFGRR